MGLFDRFRKSQPIKEVTYSSPEMADFLVESMPCAVLSPGSKSCRGNVCGLRQLPCQSPADR